MTVGRAWNRPIPGQAAVRYVAGGSSAVCSETFVMTPRRRWFVRSGIQTASVRYCAGSSVRQGAVLPANGAGKTVDSRRGEAVPPGSRSPLRPSTLPAERRRRPSLVSSPRRTISSAKITESNLKCPGGRRSKASGHPEFICLVESASVASQQSRSDEVATATTPRHQDQRHFLLSPSFGMVKCR